MVEVLPFPHVCADVLAQITDIHAAVDKVGDSISFPGPARVEESLIPYITSLVTQFTQTGQVDATLMMPDGSFWRGHRDDHVVDGAWVRFRKMPRCAPTLETLPSPLPEIVQEALLEQESQRGGLVLVAGATGMGKTTTASGTIVSRLTKYGGVAYTVEQPPENPLNGWHGKGYCTQTWVKDDGAANPWARAMRSVLRSQPAGTPAILFLGEVREEEAARVAVQAANQGFLVVATSFASDVVSAIASFASHVGPELRGQFAQQFRMLVWQNINEGKLEVKMLRSTSAVVQHICEERYAAMAGELQMQLNAARMEYQEKRLRAERRL
ncbi:ATPase, T2SS/T4P/T4SS family [Paracidovorax wautersii]|uniref:Type II/IV secretion system protein n=1 Tax=Paracidovorax wautersii TaxID=1177982 RepID=A0A1I2HR38_9BURK|nr:ATPase, T2SS/T4P/T4SS family [Paracidovorax wautersii]SFF31978.1 Type II/IV secretion system protein [Paracidovorax wautersii]